MQSSPSDAVTLTIARRGTKEPLDRILIRVQSNPTYLLKTPRRSYVLRRAPSGPLLSPTAHRVDREYAILHAINRSNDALSPADRAEHGVPVPRVYALCMDPEIAGSAFYVMEFLKGRIFQDVRMEQISKEERRAWWVPSMPSSVLSQRPDDSFR